ncbi:MAG: hypothetical protein IPJ79_10565 [Bacteroidetes bacterium]|nr:hypothetical protein [Bacteroidota bacterium]
MKTTFTLLVLILLTFQLTAQPFSIGHTTITFTDTARSRNIETEIYYPADTDGDNVPFTTAVSHAFPVLSFGHGFVMAWSAYENIWTSAAQNGYIIAFPKTETGLAPQHIEFGKDLAFVIEAIKAEGLNAISLFYNRVDTASCVMGHSMGGGASFLALQFNPSITAIANLAPAETNPSASAAAATISVPALVIAGQNDCVTPTTTNQLPMYNALLSSCKTYIEINGGSHCQMAESNFFCNFGEATCTPAPTISRATQHAVINRYLIAWLDKQLKGNCSAGILFDSTLTIDTDVTFLRSCLQCSTTAINTFDKANAILIMPQPSSDYITILHNGINAGEQVSIIFYSANGKIVFNDDVKWQQSNFINIQKLKAGLFTVVLKTKRNMYNVRFSVV